MCGFTPTHSHNTRLNIVFSVESHRQFLDPGNLSVDVSLTFDIPNLRRAERVWRIGTKRVDIIVFFYYIPFMNRTSSPKSFMSHLDSRNTTWIPLFGLPDSRSLYTVYCGVRLTSLRRPQYCRKTKDWDGQVKDVCVEDFRKGQEGWGGTSKEIGGLTTWVLGRLASGDLSATIEVW